MINALFDELYGTQTGANKILVPQSQPIHGSQAWLFDNAKRSLLIKALLLALLLLAILFAFFLFQDTSSDILSPEMPPELAAEQIEKKNDFLNDAVGFLIYKEKKLETVFVEKPAIEPEVEPEPELEPKPKPEVKPQVIETVSIEVEPIELPQEEYIEPPVQKPADVWGKKVVITQRQGLSEKQADTSTTYDNQRSPVSDEQVYGSGFGNTVVQSSQSVSEKRVTSSSYASERSSVADEQVYGSGSGNTVVKASQSVSEKRQQPSSSSSGGYAAAADERVDTSFTRDEVRPNNTVSTQVASKPRIRLNDISCSGINNAAIKSKIQNYVQHQARTVQCSGFSFKVNADVISVVRVDASHSNKGSCEILQDIDKYCL